MNERDVFIAALQLESRAQRQVYLEDACGGDEALRRRVEALLQTHARAGNFLQEPVLGQVGAAIDVPDQSALAQLWAGVGRGEDTPLSQATSCRTQAPQAKATQTQTAEDAAEPPSLGFLAPPQQPDELGRLGHYRVLRLLGQGGMGMVFLADDTRLQRSVALKVMRPELAANAEGRQRFLREGRAAARVRSDHVVTIYHVEQAGNLPYLVMELLPGQSLAKALEQGSRLPLGVWLRVARETAEGLAAAHASGLIHRDVKPGNIWLEEPAGRVKLLDFGLARAVADKRLTQQGMLIGTPSYMSPEQAGGQPVDARSDLFSLGSVLYRMATGKEPFDRGDLFATVVAVGTEPARPPHEVNVAIPAAVSQLILRLLAKDPAGRPASAAEVARALLALERDAAVLAAAAGTQPGPTSAATTGPSGRRAVSSARLRLLVLAAGLGAAGLASALLAAALAGAFRSRPPDRQSAGPAPTGPVMPAPPDQPPLQAFRLSAHPYGQIEALAFSPDGNTLVSAEYSNGEATFWDLNRRAKTDRMFAVFGGQLQALAVDPQGHWLAVGEVGPDIHLFRFGEHVAAAMLKGHTDRVVQLVFLKDGRTLLSTGYDGSIRSWDIGTRQEGKSLRAPGSRIDCLAVWEDGKGGLRLAFTSYGDDGVFVSLDGVVLERVTAGPDRVALSPDGTRLACTAGGNGNGVALWDVRGKTRLGLLPEAPFPRGLAFTPDGKHIVVMGRDDTRIYETASGKLVARVDPPEKAVYGSLAVSPDACWLAVGTDRGTVCVWHLPSLLAPPG
jgi:WD40 repeat protein